MILTADFFARPTLKVAPDLLGATLFVQTDAGRCSGRIVEVEAYLGAEDPASHAFGGPTPRSAVMFGPPGRTYVYFIYGMHHCLNFVTEPEGTAGAVLIRGIEPLEGMDLMRARRGKSLDKDLCNGPGKLCQALGIDRKCSGLTLGHGPDGGIWVLDRAEKPDIEASRRIGIRKGEELPYRFSIS